MSKERTQIKDGAKRNFLSYLGAASTKNFNFTNFFEAYASIHPGKPLPSPSFLE